MASRDLTSAYFDRRTTAMKRRNALGSQSRNGMGDVSINSSKKKNNRLTAGGSDDDGRSLILLEVSHGASHFQDGWFMATIEHILSSILQSAVVTSRLAGCITIIF